MLRLHSYTSRYISLQILRLLLRRPGLGLGCRRRRRLHPSALKLAIDRGPQLIGVQRTFNALAIDEQGWRRAHSQLVAFGHRRLDRSVRLRFHAGLQTAYVRAILLSKI